MLCAYLTTHPLHSHVIDSEAWLTCGHNLFKSHFAQVCRARHARSKPAWQSQHATVPRSHGNMVCWDSRWRDNVQANSPGPPSDCTRDIAVGHGSGGPSNAGNASCEASQTKDTCTICFVGPRVLHATTLRQYHHAH